MLQVAAGSLGGLLGALLVVLLGSGRADTPRPGQELLLPAPMPAPDFELTAHTGEPFRMAERAAGKIVVLFFGYTSCPDICPLTMADLSRARSMLGDDADRVLGVMVTVDPERDTPEALGSWLGGFSPDFIGLTGTTDQLQTVATGYMAMAARSPAGEHEHEGPAAAKPEGYLVDHTGRAFVVVDGAIRMTFAPQTGADAMADGLRLMLEP